MTPVFAWMIGWTIFAGAAGAAIVAVEADAGFGPALLMLAAGGIGGMSRGAWQAALARRPKDRAGAWRQALAWAIAGAIAFGLFAVSFDATGTARRGEMPPEYRSVIRMLAWFGAVGGFLGVTAALRWALPFWTFVRAIVAGVVWSGLLLGCGIAAFLGTYYLGGAFLVDAMGWPGLVVAGIISGLATGLFLGSLGEATNRLTFRFPA